MLGGSGAAARNIEYAAGNIGSLRAGEKDDCFGHFARRADALDRDHFTQAVGAVGLAAGGMNFGINEAGAHGDDAYAFGRHLLGEADGEGVDGAFAGGIVNIFAGAAKQRCRR